MTEFAGKSVERASTRVLIPSGVLGLGFDPEALSRGVALAPDVIAIDGGSTDSGPHFLGTGTSKYADAVCRHEWRLLMQARAEASVPLIIGSCGTCGSDAQVDAMLALTQELAAELGQAPKIAVLYSEQSPDALVDAHDRGRIVPLGSALEQALDTETLLACSHIVALAGAEHIQAALRTGADIVLAGRTTDTAVIAALPLMEGRHAGASWHAAKIGECGALCSTHPTSGVVIVDIDDKGFNVQALADEARCTPRTVAAHMLYENADPFLLHEPGGCLDVRAAHYKALDDHRVRVEGSLWRTAHDYTVKLEGARPTGYQTHQLVVLRDAHYVANAGEWCERISERLADSVRDTLDLSPDDWRFELRCIGMNAALGALDTAVTATHEVGVLALITAANQALANEIARLADPLLLHCPLSDDEPLPTFAFPYSPSATPRGLQFAFCLDHVLVLQEPMEAFRLLVYDTDGKGVSEVVDAAPWRRADQGDTASVANEAVQQTDDQLDMFDVVTRPEAGFAVAESTKVADLASPIRAKNAGPFRLTIDIFCRDSAAFQALSAGLPTERIARAFGVEPTAVSRHELETLDVIKFSLARPCVQGSPGDRDMHGAQWSVLVAELTVGHVDRERHSAKSADQFLDNSKASTG